MYSLSVIGLPAGCIPIKDFVSNRSLDAFSAGFVARKREIGILSDM